MPIIEQITSYSQLPVSTNGIITYRQNSDYVELHGNTLYFNSKSIASVGSDGKYKFNALFKILDKSTQEWIKGKAVNLYQYVRSEYRSMFVLLPSGNLLIDKQAKAWFKTLYRSIDEGLRVELSFRYCTRHKLDPNKYITCDNDKSLTGQDGEVYRRYGTKLSKATIINEFMLKYGIKYAKMHFIAPKSI